jgi:hypothetical protein
MTKAWDEHRDTIISQYKVQGKPLHEVQRFMEGTYGFKASCVALSTSWLPLPLGLFSYLPVSPLEPLFGSSWACICLAHEGNLNRKARVSLSISSVVASSCFPPARVF